MWWLLLIPVGVLLLIVVCAWITPLIHGKEMFGHDEDELRFRDTDSK